MAQGGAKKFTPVVQIDKTTGKVVAKYPSIYEASEASGVHSSHIANTVRRLNRDPKRGGQRAVGGYYWVTQEYYDFMKEINGR